MTAFPRVPWSGPQGLLLQIHILEILPLPLSVHPDRPSLNEHRHTFTRILLIQFPRSGMQ